MPARGTLRAMIVDAPREEIAEHLTHCRPCRALLAFARRRGRLDDLTAWRTLLAAHLEHDRDRRQAQPMETSMKAPTLNSLLNDRALRPRIRRIARALGCQPREALLLALGTGMTATKASRRTRGCRPEHARA